MQRGLDICPDSTENVTMHKQRQTIRTSVSKHGYKEKSALQIICEEGNALIES